MGREGALPGVFTRIHPRYESPDVSTIAMGVVSTLLLIVWSVWNQNLIFDGFTAMGLMIAFYCGITGFACAIYYRHELRRSLRNMVFIGALPVAGGLMLTYVLVKSLVALEGALGLRGPDPRRGAPFAIAVLAMVLGAAILVYCCDSNPAFFRRRPRWLARAARPRAEVTS